MPIRIIDIRRVCWGIFSWFYWYIGENGTKENKKKDFLKKRDYAKVNLKPVSIPCKENKISHD